MADITPATTSLRDRIPSARIVVSAAYALCVLVQLAYLTLVVTLDLDPNGPDTARQEILDIALFGTAALVIGVVPGIYLARSDAASRVGAIVYGALSLVTIPLLWSGAPGVLGAVATWLGGLTRGRTPHSGVPRVFAIVGFCIAILNCLISTVWSAIGAFVPR